MDYNEEAGRVAALMSGPTRRHILFVITEKHLGLGMDVVTLPPCIQCGNVRTINMRGIFGKIQKGDLGKRVYLIDGLVQIENNEQRDARQAKWNGGKGPVPRIHGRPMKRGDRHE